MEVNLLWQMTTEDGSISVSAIGEELFVHDFESRGEKVEAARLFLGARQFLRETFPDRSATVTVDVNNDKMLQVMNEAGFRVEQYMMRGIP